MTKEVPIAQVELREVVARIVDPLAFEPPRSPNPSDLLRSFQRLALEKADTILAALATTQAGAVGEFETEEQAADNIVALHIGDWGWGPIDEIEGLAEHTLAVKACTAGIHYGRATTQAPASYAADIILISQDFGEEGLQTHGLFPSFNSAMDHICKDAGLTQGSWTKRAEHACEMVHDSTRWIASREPIRALASSPATEGGK